MSSKDKVLRTLNVHLRISVGEKDTESLKLWNYLIQCISDYE